MTTQNDSTQEPLSPDDMDARMALLLDEAMQKRIEAGVAWLKERTAWWWSEYCAEKDRNIEDILDGNWLADLDLKTLNLYSDTMCVLGQVGGDYDDVMDFAELSAFEGSMLGFFIDQEEYEENGLDLDEFVFWDGVQRLHWSRLTELWVLHIERLREESKGGPILSPG